jgi:hypothetical protein
MARRYTIRTENVAISAAQDLMQIKGAAGKILKIKRVAFGATDTTLPTAQMLQLKATYLPVTVTDGSGGSTPTPQKVDPGDASASFTAIANSPSGTQASTSGTAAIIQDWGVHIFAGLDFPFPAGGEPTVGPSESFVFGLASTVTGTVHGSTTVEVEEHGG